MATCRFLHHRNKLAEIRGVLGDLSRSREEVEEALRDLADVLLQCATAGECETRNLCFKLGIVKAVLGVLRSCHHPGTLSVAARCLALLSHGNDEARTELGERGAITLLLQLLTPKSPGSAPPPWPEEWVPVCEQALICLTKLTYHCSSNQQELARLGGIKLIVELATDRNILSNYNQYPPDLRLRLQELVLRKRFMSRVAPVPQQTSGERRDAILRHFPVLCESDVSTHYPVFEVELISREKEWVSLQLIRKNLAWPDSAPLPEGTRWTCVEVQEVEEGCCLWCQFCLDKPNEALTHMNRSLTTLARPDREVVTVPAPTVGDVYAGYSAPPVDPSAPDTPVYQQWFRVRLLSRTPNVLRALAVDFGFTLTLPPWALCPLPPECRGIPPQAIPCKLHGVCPPPASVSLLESSAAVICNMAFETTAFRREIHMFKGIEAMVQLAGSPNQRVVRQALGALLNMAVSESLREVIGKKGAIGAALSLVERGTQCEGEVLEYALSLLLNCSTYTTSCVALLRHLRGEAILKELSYDHSKVPKPQAKKISELAERVLFFIKCSENKVQIKDKSSPKASGGAPVKNSLRQARVIANRERACSKPVIKFSLTTSPLPLREESVDSTPHTSPRGTRGLRPSATQPLLVNSVMERGVGGVQCAFFSVFDITQFSTTPLICSVCGMMNSRSGGRLYLGVDRTGRVKGSNITRKQRDNLRIGLDNLMSQSFSPPIQPDQYHVTFLPVASPPPRTARTSAALLLTDCFVVELKLELPEYSGQIYTVLGKDARGVSCQWPHFEISDQSLDRFYYLDAMVQPVLEEKCPCYIYYRLDTYNVQSNYLWIFMSYTPDFAPVKLKMLYAATKATCKKAFDSSAVVDDIAATSKDELTLAGYRKFEEAKNAAPPLTDAEHELKMLQENEQHSDIGTGTRQSHLHGVAFPIQQPAMTAIRRFSNKELAYVQLSLDVKNEVINLEVAKEETAADSLPSLVPDTSPRYHLFCFKHTHEGDYQEAKVFIYSCPGFKSSVKERMLYSSCKEPLVSAIEDQLGQPIDKKVEISSGSELSEEFIMDEVHPKKAIVKQKFLKPKGPQNRRPKSPGRTNGGGGAAAVNGNGE